MTRSEDNKYASEGTPCSFHIRLCSNMGRAEPPSIVLRSARSSAFLGTGLEGDRAEGSGVDGETDDRVGIGPSRILPPPMSASFPRLHLATHRRLPPSFPPGLPSYHSGPDVDGHDG